MWQSEMNFENAKFLEYAYLAAVKMQSFFPLFSFVAVPFLKMELHRKSVT